MVRRRAEIKCSIGAVEDRWEIEDFAAAGVDVDLDSCIILFKRCKAVISRTDWNGVSRGGPTNLEVPPNNGIERKDQRRLGACSPDHEFPGDATYNVKAERTLAMTLQTEGPGL